MPVDTRQTAKPFVVPAPIGGLNGRDSLASMPPMDAYLLDNWVPGTATVDSRTGYVPHYTALGAAVQSLEVYTGGAASKMLAFAGGKIFNASVAGIAGPPLQSGRNSNNVQTAMFSNAGNQFLIGVSGLDVPFYYDGSVITNLLMTGMVGSASTLSNVFAFKGRLYFCQRGQLGFYYLPVGQIQGALSYYDLSQVAQRGGYLMAMASFSMDAGNGPNDYAVFITSEGEYIVFGGYDPDDAPNNWGIVSRYYSAPPIGRACAYNYNSDLIVITIEGVLPFSAIRQTGGALDTDALTSKLGTQLSAFNANSNVPGWSALLYSRSHWLVLNVPASSSIAGDYYQFVMNTKTKAWARFTNLNGICWTVFNGRLYFGAASGKVFLADEGQLDDGQPIKVDSKQAYNAFDNGYGSGFSNKQFHFAKLVVGSDGEPPLSAKLNTDYLDGQPDYVGAPSSGTGAEWDVSDWDTASWGAELNTQTFTVALGEYGQVGSLWLRGLLTGTRLKWYATKYLLTVAKGLF